MTAELKLAVADYIASMATEMAKLATTHDLSTVAYVLEVVAAEASDNKRLLESECKSKANSAA
jgi:hypothetical protein